MEACELSLPRDSVHSPHLLLPEELGPGLSPDQGSDQALSLPHRVSEPAKTAPAGARPGPGI